MDSKEILEVYRKNLQKVFKGKVLVELNTNTDTLIVTIKHPATKDFIYKQPKFTLSVLYGLITSDYLIERIKKEYNKMVRMMFYK